jgi:hypothetical protein
MAPDRVASHDRRVVVQIETLDRVRGRGRVDGDAAAYAHREAAPVAVAVGPIRDPAEERARARAKVAGGRRSGTARPRAGGPGIGEAAEALVLVIPPLERRAVGVSLRRDLAEGGVRVRDRVGGDVAAVAAGARHAAARVREVGDREHAPGDRIVRDRLALGPGAARITVTGHAIHGVVVRLELDSGIAGALVDQAVRRVAVGFLQRHGAALAQLVQLGERLADVVVRVGVRSERAGGAARVGDAEIHHQRQPLQIARPRRRGGERGGGVAGARGSRRAVRVLEQVAGIDRAALHRREGGARLRSRGDQ